MRLDLATDLRARIGAPDKEMCIRDSYKAYQGYAAGATIIVPDDTQTALIAQGIGYAASGQPKQTYPVSYTHLDVYKRQGC